MDDFPLDVDGNPVEPTEDYIAGLQEGLLAGLIPFYVPTGEENNGDPPTIFYLE